MRRWIPTPSVSATCSTCSTTATRAPDDTLPDTGVGPELERVLSPVRIVAGDYGTRVSTALVLDRDGSGAIAERTWRRDGTPDTDVAVEIGGR